MSNPLKALLRRFFQSDPNAYEWTAKDIEEYSRESDAYVMSEFVQIMEHWGCRHGHDLSGTPPMMYPEALLCTLANARDPNCLAN